MPLPQLIDYIKQRLAQGASKEEIKSSLSDVGWQMPDIEEGFKSLESPPLAEPDKLVPSANQNSQSFPSSPAILPSEPIMPDQINDAVVRQPSKSKKIPIIFAVIGLLALGGVAFGYYYIQTPEIVLKRMMWASEKIETLEYKGSVSFKSANDGNAYSSFSQPGEFTMNFSGSSDIRDASNSKALLILDMQADNMTLLGFEMRLINEILYFQITSAAFLDALDPSLSQTLSNQWLELDSRELAKQPGFEEAIKTQELSSEKIETIIKALKKYKFLEIIEQLPSEKIDGQDTYHYKLGINREEFINLYIEIGEIMEDKLSNEEIQKLREGFDKLKKVDAEVWIGKNDLLIKKIIADIEVEEEGLYYGKISTEMKAEMLFSNYNKTVDIQKPSPTKKLEEILGPLFSGFLQGMGAEQPQF